MSVTVHHGELTIEVPDGLPPEAIAAHEAAAFEQAAQEQFGMSFAAYRARLAGAAPAVPDDEEDQA